jgi:hypothetical protein
MTPKKHRACRKNLKTARTAVQLKRVLRAATAAYEALQPYRQQEWRLIEAAAAESQAEQKSLEPPLRQNPPLGFPLEGIKSVRRVAECRLHEKAIGV